METWADLVLEAPNCETNATNGLERLNTCGSTLQPRLKIENQRRPMNLQSELFHCFLGVLMCPKTTVFSVCRKRFPKPLGLLGVDGAGRLRGALGIGSWLCWDSVVVGVACIAAGVVVLCWRPAGAQLGH
ncbi:hypothetical protein CRG98_006201 [Punica granatum]|uniref:Uncharacterized protein n=1 Tax=Punica granatum TaxID=22663 RepID=A0A2I0KY80_PUNGR|nr:hypothetical protein CRG98_006201 [Punica granatum]